MIIDYTSKYGARVVPDVNDNTGNDIVLPKFSQELLNEIIDHNELELIDTVQMEDNFVKYLYKSNKFKETKVIVIKRGNELKKLEFNGRFFLSTFVKLDIPKGFDFDIRNRSGNFKRNINVIMGLIDNPYTGFMGLQLKPHYGFAEIKLDGETAISQIKTNIVYPNREFNRLAPSEFEKKKTVIIKKQKRGAKGFGSTGK